MNKPVVDLSKKAWFTLAELAERWVCLVEDVLHFGTIGKLRIGYNFKIFKGVLVENRPLRDRPLKQNTPYTSLGVHHISVYDIGKFENGVEQLRPEFIFTKDGKAVNTCWDIHGKVLTEGDRRVDWVHRDRLIVLREECDRFERENGPPPKLEGRIQKSLQSILVILAKKANMPTPVCKQKEEFFKHIIDLCDLLDLSQKTPNEVYKKIEEWGGLQGVFIPSENNVKPKLEEAREFTAQ